MSLKSNGAGCLELKKEDGVVSVDVDGELAWL